MPRRRSADGDVESADGFARRSQDLLSGTNNLVDSDRQDVFVRLEIVTGAEFRASLGHEQSLSPVLGAS